MDTMHGRHKKTEQRVSTEEQISEFKNAYMRAIV